jgi:hypothetical protein
MIAIGSTLDRFAHDFVVRGNFDVAMLPARIWTVHDERISAARLKVLSEWFLS